MCAILDGKQTARYKKRTKHIIAWKIVRRNGSPLFFSSRFSYFPGINIAKRNGKPLPRDYKYRPRLGVGGVYSRMENGIHAYLQKAEAERLCEATIGGSLDRTVVPVSINPKHILAVEEVCPDQEIVARSVFVDRKAWEEAGVVFKKKRKRKQK